MNRAPQLRCPICQSRRIAYCNCGDPECVYRQCFTCLHQGHYLEFTTMAKIKPQSDESRSQEHRHFWPEDDELRDEKLKPPFVIEERWRNDEAKWRRFIKGHWVVFGQVEALRIARAEKRDAKVMAAA